MKNILKLCALSIIIFAAAGILSAQETADVSKEFNAIQTKSYELKRGKSYRSSTNTETFDNKGAILMSKVVSVYEVLPPDRSFYSSTYEMDSVTKKFETIQIGEKRFVRSEDGKWKIDDSKATYGVGSEGRESVKFVGKTTFINQMVNVYEVKGSKYSSGEGDSQFTAKYWFNEAGFLLKEESENIFTDKIVRRVSMYEYDANIKIEEPVLNKKTK